MSGSDLRKQWFYTLDQLASRGIITRAYCDDLKHVFLPMPGFRRKILPSTAASHVIHPTFAGQIVAEFQNRMLTGGVRRGRNAPPATTRSRWERAVLQDEIYRNVEAQAREILSNLPGRATMPPRIPISASHRPRANPRRRLAAARRRAAAAAGPAPVLLWSSDDDDNDNDEPPPLIAEGDEDMGDYDDRFAAPIPPPPPVVQRRHQTMFPGESDEDEIVLRAPGPVLGPHLPQPFSGFVYPQGVAPADDERIIRNFFANMQEFLNTRSANIDAALGGWGNLFPGQRMVFDRPSLYGDEDELIEPGVQEFQYLIDFMQDNPVLLRFFWLIYYTLMYFVQHPSATATLTFQYLRLRPSPGANYYEFITREFHVRDMHALLNMYNHVMHMAMRSFGVDSSDIDAANRFMRNMFAEDRAVDPTKRRTVAGDYTVGDMMENAFMNHGQYLARHPAGDYTIRDAALDPIVEAASSGNDNFDVEPGENPKEVVIPVLTWTKVLVNVYAQIFIAGPTGPEAVDRPVVDAGPNALSNLRVDVASPPELLLQGVSDDDNDDEWFTDLYMSTRRPAKMPVRGGAQRKLRGGWSLFETNRSSNPNPFITDKAIASLLVKSLFIHPSLDARLLHSNALAKLPFKTGISEWTDAKPIAVNKDNASFLDVLAQRHRFSCLFDCLENFYNFCISSEQKEVGSEEEHALSIALRSDAYRDLRMHHFGINVTLTDIESFLQLFHLQLIIRRPVKLMRDAMTHADIVLESTLDDILSGFTFSTRLYPPGGRREGAEEINPTRIGPIGLICDHYFLFDVFFPVSIGSLGDWWKKYDEVAKIGSPFDPLDFYNQVSSPFPRRVLARVDIEGGFLTRDLLTPKERKHYMTSQQLWMLLQMKNSRLIRSKLFCPIDSKEMLFWLFCPSLKAAYFRRIKATQPGDVLELRSYEEEHEGRFPGLAEQMANNEFSPFLSSPKSLMPRKDFASSDQLPKGSSAQAAFFRRFPEALARIVNSEIKAKEFKAKKRICGAAAGAAQMPPTIDPVALAASKLDRLDSDAAANKHLIAGIYTDVLAFDTETYNTKPEKGAPVPSRVCPYLVMWLSLKEDGDVDPEVLRANVTATFDKTSDVTMNAKHATKQSDKMQKPEFLNLRHFILPVYRTFPPEGHHGHAIGNGGSYFPFFQWLLEKYGRSHEDLVFRETGNNAIPKVLLYAHNSTFDLSLLLHQDSGICISRCERGSKNVSTKFLVRGKSCFASSNGTFLAREHPEAPTLSVFVTVYDSHRMIPMALKALPDALGLVVPGSEESPKLLSEVMVKEEICYAAYNEDTVQDPCISWEAWETMIRKEEMYRLGTGHVHPEKEPPVVEEIVQARLAVSKHNALRWGCLAERTGTFLHRQYSFQYCFNDCYILLQALKQWRKLWFSMDQHLDAFSYCSLPSLSEAFLVHHGVYLDVPQVGGFCNTFLQRATIGAKIASNVRVCPQSEVYGTPLPFHVLVGAATKSLPEAGVTTWHRTEQTVAVGEKPRTFVDIAQSEEPEFEGNGVTFDEDDMRTFNNDFVPAPLSKQAIVDFDAVGLYLSVMGTTPGGFPTGTPSSFFPVSPEGDSTHCSLYAFLQTAKVYYGAYTLALWFPPAESSEVFPLDLPNFSYLHEKSNTRLWTNDPSKIGHAVLNHVTIERLFCQLHEVKASYLRRVKVYGGLVWKKDSWNTRIHEVAALLKDKRDECKKEGAAAKKEGRMGQAAALNALQMVYKLCGNSAYGKNGQKLGTSRSIVVHSASKFLEFLNRHRTSVLAFRVIRAPTGWERSAKSPNLSLERMREVAAYGQIEDVEDKQTPQAAANALNSSAPLYSVDALNPSLDSKWSFSVELPLHPFKVEQRNRAYVAALILDEAKFVMGRVTKAMQVAGGIVYYQDTDSMHVSRCHLSRGIDVYNSAYPDLPALVGSGFLQFHSDFEEPHSVPVDGERAKGEVVSTEFVFCGKKVYANRLWQIVTKGPEEQLATRLCCAPPFASTSGVSLNRLRLWTEQFHIDDQQSNRGMNEEGTKNLGDVLTDSCVQYRAKGLPLPLLAREAIRHGQAGIPIHEVLLRFFSENLAFGGRPYSFQMVAGEGGASLFKRVAAQRLGSKNQIPGAEHLPAGGRALPMAVFTGGDTAYLALEGSCMQRSVAFSVRARSARTAALLKDRGGFDLENDVQQNQDE